MDMFKVLARGAKIRGKHQNDLELFRQTPKTSFRKEHDLERKLHFFSKPAKRTVQVSKAPEDDLDNVELVINSEEDAASHRASHRIKVTGTDLPLPIASFTDLVRLANPQPPVLRNLERLGFSDPTPIQSEAIPALSNHRDLIACAPTGSGKTLAFVIPIINSIAAMKNKGVKAVIVSPTRELATQIYEVAVQTSRGLDLSIGVVNKSLLAKLRNNNAGAKQHMDLVISTPLRLIEALKTQLLDLSTTQFLVLDEADRLLGDGFVEQTDEIVASCTNNSLVKAIFSATMPANVEDLANSIMHSAVRVIVGYKEAASDTIEQSLQFCGNEHGKLHAIRQMLTGGEVVPPILVFVQSIARAKALFHELLYDKVNVDVIHSELTQNQRDRVVNNFKQGDIWVLICTDVLARGIDFHGVNLVINYDVPQNGQAYVHRIGRTGRAGRKGKAVTLYTKQDVATLRPILNIMKQSGCEISDWLLESTRQRKNKRNIIERDQISTVPRVFKKQRKRKQEIIEGSKRRAQKSSAKE
ncbi:ATP-dependent RNA helicase ROK1 [Wickerhamiella sorbophila]|uniref:RNA helicase n=1 Tax=Wickerhamiella sorbophila TaxID=45607 RepID=A0A2T0FHY8_9ASCO|nr:ATP-dependent RNA helicase ROK1 [Wickerhamiella sorbophila]PRT54559.1 ATP-dependent RNA helicase ROK1 [Wickerhamiella sorbophila]